jgi:hypothetical protein
MLVICLTSDLTSDIRLVAEGADEMMSDQTSVVRSRSDQHMTNIVGHMSDGQTNNISMQLTSKLTAKLSSSPVDAHIGLKSWAMCEEPCMRLDSIDVIQNLT